MRYTIVFEHRSRAWAVVDSFSPGLVVALLDDLDAAKDRAWREEESWRKVHPFTERPSRGQTNRAAS